jgi:Flp pilus assembly protein TadB
MRLRILLVALIAISTVAFVVGTAIERNSKHTESAATLKAEGNTVQAGETAAHRKAESAAPKTTTADAKAKDAHAGESATHRKAELAHMETHAELKPLGIDIEAAPFVALAAAASLFLALGAWLRPRWLLLLVGIATAMLVFAALDVREVFHQSDESRTGLAVLAGFVALLHLGAAATAGVMGREARRAAA